MINQELPHHFELSVQYDWFIFAIFKENRPTTAKRVTKKIIISLMNVKNIEGPDYSKNVYVKPSSPNFGVVGIHTGRRIVLIWYPQQAQTGISSQLSNGRLYPKAVAILCISVYS